MMQYASQINAIIPEPGTCALLGTTGIILLRRRR